MFDAQSRPSAYRVDGREGIREMFTQTTHYAVSELMHRALTCRRKAAYGVNDVTYGGSPIEHMAQADEHFRQAQDLATALALTLPPFPDLPPSDHDAKRPWLPPMVKHPYFEEPSRWIRLFEGQPLIQVWTGDTVGSLGDGRGLVIRNEAPWGLCDMAQAKEACESVGDIVIWEPWFPFQQ